ncbi:MAG: CinA family protein [Henriciella sp.]|nr:CinA family protein [Henriciella sp.]
MERLLPLAELIGTKLQARGEKIAVWESSAGGLVSAALLAVPGASRFYRGAGIIYTPAAFKGLMGMRKEDLQGHRSSTEPYALIMAGTIRERMRADWGLCETGASGPSGNGYGDDAGHVCVGIVGAETQVAKTLETGLSDRIENMYLFAEFALQGVADQLS